MFARSKSKFTLMCETNTFLVFRLIFIQIFEAFGYTPISLLHVVFVIVDKLFFGNRLKLLFHFSTRANLYQGACVTRASTSLTSILLYERPFEMAVPLNYVLANLAAPGHG